MKDLRIEAVPQVSAVTAIELVNRLQMQTQAWRYTFNEDKFPLEEQLALSIVASQSYTKEGNAPTTDTHKALSLMLSFSPSKGDRKLRNLEGRGYLRQDQNEENYKVHHWRLKDLETAEKVEALAELFGKVEEVILAQKADPQNPAAGSNLVPPSIYFNVVANQIRHRSDEEVE